MHTKNTNDLYMSTILSNNTYKQPGVVLVYHNNL